jgi:hypothetical protein
VHGRFLEAFGQGFRDPSYALSRAGAGYVESISALSRTFANRSGWREFQTVLTGLRREKRFVVLLNDEMGEPQAVEVLCHEWAHALAWNFAVDRLINAPDTDLVAFERACHDEAWGCGYSRVWRAYLDVIREAA